MSENATALPYLFTSSRLGFREWRESDIPLLAAMNRDEQVMRYFPGLQSVDETAAFVSRMQQEYKAQGFCYFALDRLDTGAFIGFTGLSVKNFEASFTPCTDIGWRLHPQAWHQGFATEAARRCIQYGFEEIGLEEIVAMAPVVNKPSIQVMEKAGMKLRLNFNHPALKGNAFLESCVLYSIRK